MISPSASTARVTIAVSTPGRTARSSQLDGRDQRPQGDGAERRDAARPCVHGDGEGDDDEGVRDQNHLGIGAGIHVLVNIKRQNQVLLPEHDPISGKDQQEQNKAAVAEHGEKVASYLAEAGLGFVAGLPGVAVKDQHDEEHQKHAERGQAEDVFHPHAMVYPASEEGTQGAADIHHGVVDRVSDGADVLPGGARGGADNAGLDERYAKGRQEEG